MDCLVHSIMEQVDAQFAGEAPTITGTEVASIAAYTATDNAQRVLLGAMDSSVETFEALGVPDFLKEDLKTKAVEEVLAIGFKLGVVTLARITGIELGEVCENIKAALPAYIKDHIEEAEEAEEAAEEAEEEDKDLDGDSQAPETEETEADEDKLHEELNNVISFFSGARNKEK